MINDSSKRAGDVIKIVPMQISQAVRETIEVVDLSV
jgi:hypothetical protein